MSFLKSSDPQIYQALQGELARQRDGLEMIASENYVSPAVLEAQGSVLTNKYAEGYPGRRYYGGCQYADICESLAVERAKRLFQAGHANVQPHSGSQANMAVYFAALSPGDKIMGLSLSHGGHLTHGAKVNFSGSLYQSVFYTLDPATERLDYDRVEAAAKKEKPQMIVAGFSAYPRETDFKIFREIADRCGAKLTADIAHIAGLVAAGLHSSPVPYAHYVTSTTHKTLRGPRGGLILTAEEAEGKAVGAQIFPGIQGGPLEHVIAAKAVAFKEAETAEFKEGARRTVANAKAFAKELQRHNFRLVTGGTDNHLLLVDLSAQNLTGKEAEEALGRAGITVNKNTIPNEKRSPFVTSGLRIGTPALTARGMGEREMQTAAEWTAAVLKRPKDRDLQQEIRREVGLLCKKFPIYTHLAPV